MPPVLLSTNLKLRPASLSDVDCRFALGAEPDENLRLYGVQPESVPLFTKERAERWVQSLIDHPYAWIIESSGLLGSVRLDRVNFTDRRASFAIGLLRSDCMGRGIGTEAARTVLKYAFSELKLHRVSLRVLAINERAIRSYQKCGFHIEGREREAAFLDGKWHDDLIMGLLEYELRLGEAAP
jgi:RimJ/RimL family protein N-acetyltransferase